MQVKANSVLTINDFSNVGGVIVAACHCVSSQQQPSREIPSPVVVIDSREVIGLGSGKGLPINLLSAPALLVGGWRRCVERQGRQGFSG